MVVGALEMVELWTDGDSKIFLAKSFSTDLQQCFLLHHFFSILP